MGSIASKTSTPKPAERNSSSWYAPVSRSISAPIHYRGENGVDEGGRERENIGVVPLTSSSHGFHTMEVTPEEGLVNTGSTACMGNHCRYSSCSVPTQRQTSRDGSFDESSKLKPVTEEEDADMLGGVEAINTWEVVEDHGCEEEEEGKKEKWGALIGGGGRRRRRRRRRSLRSLGEYEYGQGHGGIAKDNEGHGIAENPWCSRDALGGGGRSRGRGRRNEEVVLYFTRLRCVRKTFNECRAALQMLHALGVLDVDERDVWMHSKFREELTQLMSGAKVAVPRIFIRGRDLGPFDDFRSLYEDGTLAPLVSALTSSSCLSPPDPCPGCYDVRFVPCELQAL